MSDRSINDENVDVIVPLTARYASTLRTMSASFGAETGFSIDEIDDFKLGVTEAFSMLVSKHAGTGDRARVSFGLSASALAVRLSLESGEDFSVEPDELALAILKAVVDSYELNNGAITLRKVAIETLLLDS